MTLYLYFIKDIIDNNGVPAQYQPAILERHEPNPHGATFSGLNAAQTYFSEISDPRKHPSPEARYWEPARNFAGVTPGERLTDLRFRRASDERGHRRSDVWQLSIEQRGEQKRGQSE